jgi:hypothetical protein
MTVNFHPAVNFISEIKNDITGAQALADWLGGEAPVRRTVATTRGVACLDCPLNVEPGWLERNLKKPIARWITRQLEEKNRMQLETHWDDQLHMCKACGCPMKLKVWTPTSVLRRHVTRKQLTKTPAFCWLRKELL